MCLAIPMQLVERQDEGATMQGIGNALFEEMAYVETLYGHQAGVTAVSCPRRERPVSAGRDRTVRSWKLAEETLDFSTRDAAYASMKGSATTSTPSGGFPMSTMSV